jgi:carbon monoxide dehydrogenase subunit G
MNLSFNTQVNATNSKVFQVFTDFQQAAERIDGIEHIEILGDGTVAAGMKFRETRKMFGKDSTEEMTISEFEQDSRIVISADTCGSHFETEFKFHENGNGTNVEVNVNTVAHSLFAKLMSPVGFLMAGPMKKMLKSDIRQLKEICEQH